MYFEEAVKHEKWKAVMDSNMKSIEKNETWVLTDLSTDAKKISI